MSRVFPTLLALTLAACSSSSTHTTGTGATGTTGGSSATATTGGTGGAITVATFNAAFNTAACKFELTCEEGPYAPYIIDAICNSGVLPLFDLSDLPLAVDAGRMTFNAAQATACVNALASTVCSDVSVLPCESFLTGTTGIVPPAGACYSSSDCLSDGCTGSVSSTCTAGTCNGIVGPGGACECTNCGSCNPDAGLLCFNNVCTVPGAVGQPCDDASHTNCAPGLACVGNVCVTVPVAAGNACSTGDWECVPGNYCFEQASASAGNCATQVAAGQPCGEDVNHADNAFSLTDNECAGSHAVCLGAGVLLDGGPASGTCSTLQDVGGPCSAPGPAFDTASRYNNGCYGGLNCIGGVCVKAPSSGACSTATNACDITVSFCASATNTCLPYIAAGGTCNPSDNSPCGINKTCNNTNDICEGTGATCSPKL